LSININVSPGSVAEGHNVYSNIHSNKSQTI